MILHNVSNLVFQRPSLFQETLKIAPLFLRKALHVKIFTDTQFTCGYCPLRGFYVKFVLMQRFPPPFPTAFSKFEFSEKRSIFLNFLNITL